MLLRVNTYHHHTTTVLWPFFWDHPGEPVPEENFWTLWCKGRLTEADTPTIRLGATLSRLTSAQLHHPPHIFTGRMPFLPPNQQRQSTEGNYCIVFRMNTCWKVIDTNTEMAKSSVNLYYCSDFMLSSKICNLLQQSCDSNNIIRPHCSTTYVS